MQFWRDISGRPGRQGRLRDGNACGVAVSIDERSPDTARDIGVGTSGDVLWEKHNCAKIIDTKSNIVYINCKIREQEAEK